MPRRNSILPRPLLLAGLGLLLLGLPGCGYGDPDTVYPRSNPAGGGGTYEPRESLLGPEGFSLAALTGNSATEPGGGSGIGVNSFLWRASLDTISFMPLVSADPFGGVIITDWYAPPESPDERVKITVYILGRELRADGIRAAVFRQRRDGGGAWIDATVEKRTQVELEDAILTRARQLRVAGLQ
jgi:hypothetical protein